MSNGRQESLEVMAKELGAILRNVLKEEGIEKEVGFALQMFTYGDQGELSYTSSAQRPDMIRVLRECADVIEKGGQSKVDRIIRSRLQQLEDTLHKKQAMPVFTVAFETQNGKYSGKLELIKCPEIDSKGMIHLLEHCKFILKTPVKGVDASH
jgi:hypothetical protein